MIEKGVKRQAVYTTERKSFDDAAKTADFVINSDQVDRDEEIVLPSAIASSIDIYMRNPVFLWQHRQRGNPEDLLGQTITLNMSDQKISATFQYDVEFNPQAAFVFQQVKKKTVRAVSIGFIPLEWVTAYSAPEKIDALPGWMAKGLRDGTIWVVHTRVELVEISQVIIGSNREALAASSGDRALERLLESCLQKLTESKALEIQPEATMTKDETEKKEPEKVEATKEAEPVEDAPAKPEAEAKDAEADDKLEKALEEVASLKDSVKTLTDNVGELTSLTKQMLKEMLIASL